MGKVEISSTFENVPDASPSYPRRCWDVPVAYDDMGTRLKGCVPHCEIPAKLFTTKNIPYSFLDEANLMSRGGVPTGPSELQAPSESAVNEYSNRFSRNLVPCQGRIINRILSDEKLIAKIKKIIKIIIFLNFSLNI